MKELINYKTVTQITETYIHARPCGEYTRYPITKEALNEAYNVFREEFEFYNRMLEELCLAQKAFEEEKDSLVRRLERLEKQKAESMDDPLVRRGLGTLNWEIEVVERALTELAHKSSGVSKVQNRVVEKTVKYIKLRKEVEAVYNKLFR